MLTEAKLTNTEDLKSQLAYKLNAFFYSIYLMLLNKNILLNLHYAIDKFL